MSRSRRSGQGSAFSLFPFLAVLLCTMGAMVVLLVAMAHVARQKAQREAEAVAATADSSRGDLAQRRLTEARSYRDRLGEVRSDAARRLHEEQDRLSGIEDHIRRLQDEVESLQAEALELIALEEEHYEDRRAAEAELARQQALIESLQDEIDELESEAAARSRRYAVVPLRDQQTGTSRPAVYFECRKDGVVLQPEGIVLGPDDFAPPIELSSPLAAALRAINQYYADHPQARAANEAGAPYALLVVRPGGVEAYQRARAILEAIDVDYGYQPVAEDWPLEYEAAKPDLSNRVARAIELARAERERLAHAAPQLFKQQNLGGGLEWSDRVDGGVSLVGAGDGTGFGGPNVSPRFTATPGHGAPGETPGTSPTAPAGAAPLQALIAPSGSRPGDQGEPNEPTSEPASAEGQPAEEQPASGQLASTAAASAPADTSGGGGSGGTPVASSSSQAASAQSSPNRGGAGGKARTRDKDSRHGIAMRRTISLAVYDDRLVVLPQEAASLIEAEAEAAYGEAIPLTGPTRSQGAAITAALRRHTKSWGIAGDGFYWKPRLRLHVAAGGYRRAEELSEAFRRAGVEVAPIAETASAGGGDHGPRR